MSGIKQLLRPSICSKIDGLLSGLVTAIIEPPSCGKFEMWQAEQNLTLLDTNILSSPRPSDLCFFRSTTTTLHIRTCSLVFLQFAEFSNTKYFDAMYLTRGWEKVLRIHSCPHKAKVKKATDLRRGGGEGHQGEVLALLGEVVVGDGEAQHLGEVGQLLLGRHALACAESEVIGEKCGESRPDVCVNHWDGISVVCLRLSSAN